MAKTLTVGLLVKARCITCTSAVLRDKVGGTPHGKKEKQKEIQSIERKTERDAVNRNQLVKTQVVVLT